MTTEYTYDFTKHTLADIVGLAEGNGDRPLTFGECAEILEAELPKRYPYFSSIAQGMYATTREKCSVDGQGYDVKQYCHKLVELGRFLGDQALVRVG